VKKSDTPLVSVIIPVYNAGSCLKKCLESVINQTLKDIEAICIDDGSTDGSWQILQKYAKRDKRITAVKQKNQGAAVARNKGLELASGEYIGFVDSDDYVDNDYFEELYSTAKKYEADIARAYVRAGNNRKIANTRIQQPDPADYEYNYNVNLRALISKNKLYQKGTIWVALYRRDMLVSNSINFPSALRSGQDEAFNLRTSYCANKIMYIDKPTYYHRVVRDNSLSTAFVYTDDGLISRALVLKDAVDYLSAKQDYSKEVYINRMLDTYNYIFSRLSYVSNRKVARKVSTILDKSWRKTKHKEDIAHMLPDAAVVMGGRGKIYGYICNVASLRDKVSIAKRFTKEKILVRKQVASIKVLARYRVKSTQDNTNNTTD